jgi:CDP-glycerol glycerophosphotransferase
MRAVPRISVVVPIYNVEDYLLPCLESIAAQRVDDLEVVMVDDGSTDGSGGIAQDFADRDPRFKLIRQANGGLSSARNTGIEAATGELLAFVDSDDVLAADAYARLLGALERTGSDFATGNVHRLTDEGTAQAPFLARTFTRTMLRTHVTRFRPLIADRIVWNKLWRRDFWDRNGYRFPEGRVHEDIPVVVPAQFAARSVDVIAEPVYYWRVREQSITRRRLEPRALLDRVQAIEEVRAHLDRSGPRRARRWYDASIFADDLKLHLNVLHHADPEYRQLFLEKANALLDATGAGVLRGLAAIDRLKWHLVRRRLEPELLEVLRFEERELDRTPPLRIRGRWYGDYPFLGDRRLRIPRSVYRLNRADLPGVAHVDSLDEDGPRIHVRGFAYVSGIGALTPRSQRVSVTAVRAGRLRRLRLLLRPVRLNTRQVRRPGAVPAVGPPCDLTWSGYEATLDPAALRTRRGWAPRSLELYVTVRAGGVTRRRVRFLMDEADPPRPVAVPVGPGVTVEAAPTDAGGVELRVRRDQPPASAGPNTRSTTRRAAAPSSSSQNADANAR